MSDLNAKIIAKASGTAGEVPQASDLDVAELAVNTADGKLFTKHTDDSVVEISGGGSGGGGAVDSVNGQTGVVSLGIQDMDDYEPASLVTTTFRYDTALGGANTPGGSSQPANTNYLYINATDANGVDSVFDVLGPSVNNPLYLSNDGGQNWWSVTPTSVVAPSTQITLFVGTGGGWSDGNGVLTGEFLISTTQDLSLTPVAPEDGDILQWNAANQAFQPTQLPSAGDVVNTINGETGNVLLGVGELIDTAVGSFIAPATPQVTATTPDATIVGGGEWTSQNITINRNQANSGFDGADYSYLQGEEIRIYETNAAGVPSGVIWTVTVNTVESQSSGADAFYRFNFSNQGTAPSAAHFRVSTGVMPQDGQALVYQESTSTWIASTVAGGGGAVDSVNGETGVVSLGIQDMDDFELNLPATGGLRYIFKASSSTDMSNGAVWNSGGMGDFRPNLYKPADAGGANVESLWDTIQEGDQITVVYDPDGINYTGTGTVSSLVPNASSNRIVFTLDGVPSSQFSNNDDKEIFFISQKLGVVEVPLQAGDILQWDDIEQKFKPAQISGSGSGAVDSVNGQTGVVKLDIDDLGNVSNNYVGTPNWLLKGAALTSASAWTTGTNAVLMYASGDSGLTVSADYETAAGLEMRATGGEWVRPATRTLIGDNVTGEAQATFTTADYALGNFDAGGVLSVRWDALKVEPTENQRLAYSDAESAWVPVDYVEYAAKWEVQSNLANGFTVSALSDRTIISATRSGSITVSFSAVNAFDGAQLILVNKTGNDLTVNGAIETANGYTAVADDGQVLATYTRNAWHLTGDLYSPGATFTYTLDGATDFSADGTHNDGDLIVHNGTEYENRSAATVVAAGLGSSAIQDLGNVVLSDTTDNQYLVYDSASGNWVSEQLDVSGIVNEVQVNTDLDELANVTTTNKQDGDNLVWNAGLNAWTTGGGNTGGDDTKVDKLIQIQASVGDYTVQASDSAGLVEVNSASVVTLPSSLATGFQVVIFRNTAGEVSIQAQGVIRSAEGATRLNVQYSTATAIHKGGGEWYLFGDLKL